MKDVGIRYTYTRKSDGQLWTVDASLNLLEGSRPNQISTMSKNKMWDLTGRELYAIHDYPEPIAAIKCGEIEIEAKEAARILEAFDLVRMI
jgi:hypothetical protein